MQIYLHIPFCKSKCRYCDFASYACCDDELIFRYLNALNKEMELARNARKNKTIDTVYVGGGTPSLLEGSLMWSFLNSLACIFDFDGVKEWTIECNPESLNEEKLKIYKDVGVNRISLGVQSLRDDNLKTMGRLHSAQMALDKLKLAGKYFDNISADLIIGLPYDDEASVREQVATLSPLVSHLSMYELSVEEGTALDKLVKRKKIVLPDVDTTQNLFDVAFAEARAHSFDRYEVSNFAKDGKISHHNFGYWTREEYFGFGAGAHSFEILPGGKQVRYSNFASLEEYIATIEQANCFDDIKRATYEELSPKDIQNETVMLALRTSKGIREEFMPKVPGELECFFVRKDGYVSLTDRGMSVMNSILTQILDF